MPMPSCSQTSDIRRRQQIRSLCEMRARIESIAVRTTVGVMRVDILQVLALVLEDTGILEAGTIFQSPNIASERAGFASLKAAHEHILAIIFILVLHSRYFASSPFLQSRTASIRSIATCRCGLKSQMRAKPTITPTDPQISN